MSRLSAIVRRDAPSWILLALGIVIIAMAAAPATVVADTTSPAQGASPFLPVFAALLSCFPALKIPGADLPLGHLLLSCLTALGFFYASWRLTRNRVVSMGAGFLAAVHPLALDALFSPSGIRDLLGMAALAWLLAINAGPRFRSPRFPNLPPPAAGRTLTVFMVVAMLSAPGMWAAPLVLFIMDLFFQREPNRPAWERNWRSCLPHVLVVVTGFLLEVFFGAKAEDFGLTQSVTGWSATLGSMFFPGTAHSTGAAWLVFMVILLCLVVGALEILFDMGRLRLTLPWIGFAGGTGLVGLIVGLLPLDAHQAGGAWLGFTGFAFLIPVLAWRCVMACWPARQGDPDLKAGVPSWEEVVPHLGLAPLPDLSQVPPAPDLAIWAHVPEEPALPPGEASPLLSGRAGLEEALGRLGHTLNSERPQWDRQFFRQEVEPLLEAGEPTLAFLPSRSPYAAMLAAQGTDLSVLEMGEGGFPGLSGFSEVKVFEYDGRRPWPAAAASCTLVFSMGCLSRLRTPELKEALEEFERILRPRGRALLVFQHTDAAGGEDANPLPPEMAGAFCRDAGLEVESTGEATEGRFYILARRAAP